MVFAGTGLAQAGADGGAPPPPSSPVGTMLIILIGKIEAFRKLETFKWVSYVSKKKKIENLSSFSVFRFRTKFNPRLHLYFFLQCNYADNGFFSRE